MKMAGDGWFDEVSLSHLFFIFYGVVYCSVVILAGNGSMMSSSLSSMSLMGKSFDGK